MAAKKRSYYTEAAAAIWAHTFLGFDFEDQIWSEELSDVRFTFTRGFKMEIELKGRFWLTELSISELENLPADKKSAMKLLGLWPEVDDAEDEKSR
jgi:hypothetical protein